MRPDSLVKVKEIQRVDVQVQKELCKGRQAADRYSKKTQKGQQKPYFIKFYHGKTNLALYTVEATGGYLLRLVFGSTFTPKVRFLLEDKGSPCPPFAYRYALISREIPGYQAMSTNKAADILGYAFIVLMKTENGKRGLAKLALSVLLFEDTDLHAGNWGLDDKNNVVKIDHDRIFSTFSDSLISEQDILRGGDFVNRVFDFTHLKHWPNLLYTAAEAFGVLSEADIRQPLKHHFIRPINDPFHRMRTGGPGALLESCDADPDFIKWNFFYITKYLLLLTRERVEYVVRANSANNITPEQQQRFCNVIIDKVNKVRGVVSLMREYHAFLEQILNSQELIRELTAELLEFNQEFYDATSQVKEHKRGYIINVEEAVRELPVLKNQVFQAISQDSPEKKANRDREVMFAAIERTFGVLKNLLSFKTQLNNFVNHYVEKERQLRVKYVEWQQNPDRYPSQYNDHYFRCAFEENKKKLKSCNEQVECLSTNIQKLYQEYKSLFKRLIEIDEDLARHFNWAARESDADDYCVRLFHVFKAYHRARGQDHQFTFADFKSFYIRGQEQQVVASASGFFAAAAASAGPAVETGGEAEVVKPQAPSLCRNVPQFGS